MKIVSFAFEHTLLQTLLTALTNPFSPYLDQQATSLKFAG